MNDVDRRGTRDPPADEPITLRFDFDHATTAPSTALVEALASMKNTDPIALLEEEDVSLGDSIDLDALDRLMEDGREKDVEAITLSIDGYSVRIEAGEVVVQSGPSDT